MLLLSSLTLLSANALASEEDDPWESFNRPIFTFNDTLDTYALKPLAQGYQYVTPDPVEDGVTNFFGNLGDVKNLANDLLQGKFEEAGIDTARVLFNSTFGLLGIFDVASKMDLKRSDEDFGQTMGTWGLGSGPYVVLPFFGPSTVRDAFGKLPDTFVEPYRYVNDVPARNSAYGLNVVQARAGLLSAEKLIVGDKYVFIRNAYLQDREFSVQDGEVIDDF
jgi:phospholipid-binding lipoprotein MlaA